MNQERSPPVIDDFLYVCDDAYTRDELLEMEKNVLKAVDFDIGIPLSYTFLRRYAQVNTILIILIIECFPFYGMQPAFTILLHKSNIH